MPRLVLGISLLFVTQMRWGQMLFASDCGYGFAYSRGYSGVGLAWAMESSYVSTHFSGPRPSIPYYGRTRTGTLILNYDAFGNFPTGAPYYDPFLRNDWGPRMPVWRDHSQQIFIPGQFIPWGNRLEYIPARYQAVPSY